MPDSASTDRLTTIIEMLGAEESARRLLGVARASRETEASLSRLTTRLQIMPGLLARFNAGAAFSAGGLAVFASSALLAVSALRQVGQLNGEGMRTWDGYNQALTRALVLYHNAGRNASAAGLAGMARERLFALGIPEEKTLGLAGQMAERGFSPQRISQLLPSLQEAELGGGMASQRLMNLMLRIIQRPVVIGRGAGGAGGGRGATTLASQLGITMRFTGDTERDLTRLTEAIHDKFGGVAEALAATASGVHERYTILLTAALGRLGGLVEVGLVPALEGLNRVLAPFIVGSDFVTGRTQAGAGWAGELYLRGLQSGARLIGLYSVAGWAGSMLNQRENDRRLGRLGGGKTEDDIHKIMLNTAQMAGAMSQVLFGHASAFTQGAFSFSELNRAIAFRT